MRDANVAKFIELSGQWRRQELLFGDVAQGARERKSPSGVQGRSSGRDPGDEVSQKLKRLQTLFTDFDCRDDQTSKLWDN